jgi:arabinan endo-1,5-alpha-L-arabinosidase
MPSLFSRRRFLQSSLMMGAALGLNLPALSLFPDGGPGGRNPQQLDLTGNISPVHDPAIIKAREMYYLFCTASGIEVRRSPDLLSWRMSRPPAVFGGPPPWTRESFPYAADIWAPDISYFNDKYHLYYAVSTFGSNRSVIGLTTNLTLDREEEGFGWQDQEAVIESFLTDNYNCIDPNLIIDEEGVPWLAFGSFWSGIKMRRIDYETGKLSEEDDTLYNLAFRPTNHGAVEAPFIIRKEDFYYLFVSFDQCCQGVNSTYRVMVGRSEAVTGPYVDRDGVEMLSGGGTQVTYPTERWKGPGHNAILQEEDTDYIVYHAYDAENNGARTLRIAVLDWDEDGWPSIAGQGPDV